MPAYTLRLLRGADPTAAAPPTAGRAVVTIAPAAQPLNPAVDAQVLARVLQLAHRHPVRPDAVWRTSVLAPTGGYQPERDVHAVARQFTSRPLVTHLPAVVSPLGAPLVGWLTRLKVRFQAARSERKARRMLEKLATITNGALAPTVSGLHGIEPARQGMAVMAAKIAAGLEPMPMPSPAVTPLQRVAQIMPSAITYPAQAAAYGARGLPPGVKARAQAHFFDAWADPRRTRWD